MRFPFEFAIMAQKRQHRRNYNEPGHAHELTFSCYQGFKFLKAERTCEWLAEAIEDARVELNFDLWAYVFMPEHAHLIVRPREGGYDIADIRKSIKAPVGSKAIKYLLVEAPEWIQRITRKRGKKTERQFWQSGGGFDRNVIKPGTLMNMIDYIHMNPVRRGLVTKPEEWKWSSATWYLGGGEVPIRVDLIPPEWLDDLS
jgi:putative transposase